MAKKKVESSSEDANDVGKMLSNLKNAYGILTAEDKAKFDYKEFYDTGSTVLNYLLHGGFAVGRVIEILGDEQSGKTAIAILTAINVIKSGRSVLYFDLEQSLDPEWYNALGGNYEEDIKSDKLFIVDNINSELVHAEEIYDFMDKAVKTGAFGMVVLDSMDAIQTKDTKERTTTANGESSINPQVRDTKPKLNSVFFRSIIRPLAQNRCSLLIINQFRSTMATTPYQKEKVGGGGRALPYYSQQRLEMYKAAKPIITTRDIDKSIGKSGIAEALAYEIRFTVTKNKYGSPFGNEAVPALFWTKKVSVTDSTSNCYGDHVPGFDNEAGAVQVGLIEGLLYRSGAWFYYDRTKDEQIKAQGDRKMAIALRKADLLDEVLQKSIEKSLSVRGDKPVDADRDGFIIGI